MLLFAQIMLTLATLGYSAIPAVADFNQSHAKNPAWTGHARFHVVWQVMAHIYIAIIGLALIWSADITTGVARLWVAALLCCALYGGFFSSMLLRRAYGGKLYDDNGYTPYTKNLFGLGLEGDINVTLFSGAMVITLIAVIAVAAV